MLDQEDIYSRSIKRVSGFLFNKRIEEEVYDFVNEAWLQLIEEKSEVSVEAVFKKAVKLIYSRSNPNRKWFSKETRKFCFRCKEDLPMGAFGLYYCNRLNRKITQGWCRECMKAYLLACAKDRGRSQVVRMPDSYVSWNLRKRGLKGDITNEMIAANREEIRAKRDKRADKNSGLKYCPRCTEQKSVEEFGVRNDRNQPRPGPYCKKCNAIYQKELYHKRLEGSLSQLWMSMGFSFALGIINPFYWLTN